ncbi:unnamed protein product, partial [Amoebophrya sp. A120]
DGHCSRRPPGRRGRAVESPRRGGTFGERDSAVACPAAGVVILVAAFPSGPPVSVGAVAVSAPPGGARLLGWLGSHHEPPADFKGADVTTPEKEADPVTRAKFMAETRGAGSKDASSPSMVIAAGHEDNGSPHGDKFKTLGGCVLVRDAVNGLKKIAKPPAGLFRAKGPRQTGPAAGGQAARAGASQCRNGARSSVVRR